ncbi:MAG: AMP-dependent synthetase/ligase [Patescibacteria group bacterium]|jgi:long-chain acyl-CoA synthetase
MRTIYLQFREAAEKYNRRPIARWKRKKRWHSLSYQKFLKKVDLLSGGFRKEGIKEGDRVAIMSENCPEWLMTDLALNKIGAVSVPIHITSNRPFIEYIVKDSMSGFFIVSEKVLKKHEETIKEIARNFKVAVIRRDAPFFSRSADEADMDVNAASAIGLREELGKEYLDFDNLLSREYSDEPAADGKLASLIYTSGTTGDPKGVMLTNENFLTNAFGAMEKIKVFPRDVFLSFLPLSHVLERLAGSYVPILSGAEVAYAPDIKELARSFSEVKPTIFTGVPKIFENSYEKIRAKLEKSNPLIKKFFYYSLNKKSPAFARALADKFLYAKIRKSFGGRLRFAISGGAAINERIIKFFRKIGVKIVEGYGLTETSPIVAMNTLLESRIGSVGRPLPGVEIKIAPDKEILVKGKSVMSGYWNKEEMTGTHFTEDGWFKTGDLGFLDRENFLTIIGRKKEMIVTTNGKNISPEKVEAIINLNPLVSQCLVTGHKKPYLACLIVPEYDRIKEKYGADCDLEKCLADEMEEINNHLMSHERIKKIAVIGSSFTVEAGELTPTLKVRRSVIEHKYRREIERLY